MQPWMAIYQHQYKHVPIEKEEYMHTTDVELHLD